MNTVCEKIEDIVQAGIELFNQLRGIECPGWKSGLFDVLIEYVEPGFPAGTQQPLILLL